jgi:AAA domain
MRRVEKRFQVPSLPLNDYKDILALFESTELNPFDTIVIDTLGKLIDRMGEYVVAENPKNGNGKGSLSMQGWGALKVEFQRLLKLAQSKNKHLIFVAHDREDKDGETRFVRPDVSGSSGKDLVKDLDFMGYMEMRGNKRTISFTPTEKYYAKNALKLAPVIDVPDTEKGKYLYTEGYH